MCIRDSQRSLSGSGALPAGVRAGEWYSDAVSAVYANGLLEGLSDNFRPTAAMTREDAMQLFANLLQADGTAAMSDAETAQTLASVKDAGSISADRRNAVALLSLIHISCFHLERNADRRR